MKRNLLRLLVLALLVPLGAIQGCATRMELGSPPRLDRLAQLTPQRSTQNDVLLSLGEPKGYGYSRLGPGFERQRVWSYEYMLAQGEKIRMTMLMLFFSGDLYAGHWWFGDAIELKESRERTP